MGVVDVAVIDVAATALVTLSLMSQLLLCMGVVDVAVIDVTAAATVTVHFAET